MTLKLGEILSRADYKLLQGASDIEITDIAYDSRRVVPGAVFVCLLGAGLDGHDYIDAALDKGAVSVVVCREAFCSMRPGVTYVYCEDTRAALANMSCVYFGDPSHELSVIGITGTKGKTTVSYMIKRILESAGHKTGLIGTIQTIIGDECEKAKNTTPESYELQRLLRKMADAGCEYAVLEVSSQGLKQHRVDGTRFPLGIYTNFSRDHIGGDEHADMEEYADCKALFFNMCDTALINADCPHWQDIVRDGACRRVFYGTTGNHDIAARESGAVRLGDRLGVTFTLEASGVPTRVTAGLPGRHTVSNALAAFGSAAHFGVPVGAIAGALRGIDVPGRAQLAAEGLPFTVLIDYAHNELSMESLLRSVREYNPKRLISLFGCGGGRDRARRLAMGEKSGKYCDLTILTEDNPRFEETLDIIDDILEGLRPTGGIFEIIKNRRDAIFHMLDIAEPGDICLIIGKGHEDYQDIRGVKYPFVEKDVVAEWRRASRQLK